MAIIVSQVPGWPAPVPPQLAIGRYETLSDSLLKPKVRRSRLPWREGGLEKELTN